jgi:hypothetical protein
MNAVAARSGAVLSALWRAWSWWTAGLKAAVPDWAMTFFLDDRRRIEISPTGERLDIKIIAPGGREIAAACVVGTEWSPSNVGKGFVRLAAAHLAILRCPVDLILEKTVAVPAAACENLRQAVRFGLRTWTPFEADELVYSAKVLHIGQDVAHVRIRMVPRASLNDALQKAALAGFKPRTVAFGAEAEDDAALEDALRPDSERRIKPDTMLAASAAALMVSLTISTYVKRNDELHSYQLAVKQLAGQLGKQAKVEEDIVRFERHRAHVSRKLRYDMRVGSVLGEFADALPELADVEEITWSGSRGRAIVRLPDVMPFGPSGALTLTPVSTFPSGGQTRITVDLSRAPPP